MRNKCLKIHISRRLGETRRENFQNGANGRGYY